MRKRTIIVSMLVMVLFIVAGCQKQPATVSKESAEQATEQGTGNHMIEVEVPEEYKYSSDNLTIDIDLSVPENLILAKATATKLYNDVNTQKAGEVLFPFEDYKYEEVDGMNDMDGIIGKGYYWKIEDEERIYKRFLINPETYCLGLIDNTLSDWINCSFRYEEEKSNYELYEEDKKYLPKETVKKFEKRNKNNVDLYRKELSFASSEEAVKNCLEQLREATIDIGEDIFYECFGLDKDTMKQEYFEIDSNGDVRSESEVEDLEDCYYIFGRQQLQELPVFFFDSYNVYNPLYRENAPIQMIYSKDGMIDFECNRMFRFQVKNEYYEQLVDFEDVAELIKDRYIDILGDSTYEIDRGGLFYYAKGDGSGVNYEMVPAWVFQVKEYDKYKTEEVQSVILIDAVTGEEMEYEK